MAAIIISLVALTPGLLLVRYFYRRDIYEPEPRGRLAWAVLAGLLAALVAVLGSLAAGVTSDTIHGLAHPGALAVMTGKIGLVEEGSKLLVVLLFFYRTKEFNEPSDGVVYTAAVATGFAMIENLGYVAAGGIVTGIVRAVTAVPLHAFLGALMGNFVGRAKFARRGKVLLVLVGYLLAAALHGIYDFAAFALTDNVGALLGATIGIVLLIIAVVRPMTSRLVAQSPFKALSKHFVLTKNLGDDTYHVICQVCGTAFVTKLTDRVVCIKDSCLNYYDFELGGQLADKRGTEVPPPPPTPPGPVA